MRRIGGLQRGSKRAAPLTAGNRFAFRIFAMHLPINMAANGSTDKSKFTRMPTFDLFIRGSSFRLKTISWTRRAPNR
jgi:hypothetical protein